MKTFIKSILSYKFKYKLKARGSIPIKVLTNTLLQENNIILYICLYLPCCILFYQSEFCKVEDPIFPNIEAKAAKVAETKLYLILSILKAMYFVYFNLHYLNCS